MNIKRHIPDTVTSCNLLSGCVAIYMSSLGFTAMAAYFVILGAIFDFFDGFTARLLKASSGIGKELDSLADVVTFGVAPSFIVSEIISKKITMDGLYFGGMWLFFVIPMIPFLLAVFSALRLAKFNVDARQTTSFLGLPTPACAMFFISLGYMDMEKLPPLGLILFCVVVFSLMMVIEVPMFSMKFKSYSLKDNLVVYCFLAASATLLIIFGLKALSAVIALYIALSLFENLRKK